MVGGRLVMSARAAPPKENNDNNSWSVLTKEFVQKESKRGTIANSQPNKTRRCVKYLERTKQGVTRALRAAAMSGEWEHWGTLADSGDGSVTSVTVRVPATSANLGPGFDCLGMAVDMWNELTVEKSSSWSMMITGEGADQIPRTRENYVCVGVELVFKKFGIELPTLSYFCKNGIPFGSGLGSSSAAIVSGLLAGLVLAGKELPVNGKETLLQLAAQVEGHIDNLAPCVYGEEQNTLLLAFLCSMRSGLTLLRLSIVFILTLKVACNLVSSLTSGGAPQRSARHQICS